MLEILIFFFTVSLLFYCLLAGADFGAGILEFFFGKHRREDMVKVATYAMGPVWESNHMWMILAVVLLFNGFPRAFTQISILFHLPLVALLVGIILRGCTFVFRHYDAYEDRSHRFYGLLFSLSSAATPFILGMLAGGTLLGRANPSAATFYEVYVAAWWNVFCVSVGLFTASLFTYLAAIYLIDESEDEELREIFKARARIALFIAVLTGGLVFVAAWWEGHPLLSQLVNDPRGLSAIALATVLQPFVLKGLKMKKTFFCRILVMLQVTAILCGWFFVQFPYILIYAPESGLESLTFYNTVAPEATLKYLTRALLVGSLFIFPALFYLFHIFKLRRVQKKGVIGL